jgi:hypothetical protein
MARIEGIRIHNFRALRDVTLGRVLSLQKPEPLTPMTAVIEKNGTGKSTLFDAFGFLADCLRTGVEEAFDARGRGSFDRVKSQGADGPIEFEVYYKEEGNARPITYELSLDRDASGRPYVLKERLRQRRKGQKYGWPFSFWPSLACVRPPRWYYAAVRLPMAVHLGLIAHRLLPAFRPTGGGRPQGLSVLAREVSMHAWGLRLRRACDAQAW